MRITKDISELTGARTRLPDGRKSEPNLRRLLREGVRRFFAFVPLGGDGKATEDGTDAQYKRRTAHAVGNPRRFAHHGDHF